MTMCSSFFFLISERIKMVEVNSNQVLEGILFFYKTENTIRNDFINIEWKEYI